MLNLYCEHTKKWRFVSHFIDVINNEHIAHIWHHYQVLMLSCYAWEAAVWHWGHLFVFLGSFCLHLAGIIFSLPTSILLVENTLTWRRRSPIATSNIRYQNVLYVYFAPPGARSENHPPSVQRTRVRAAALTLGLLCLLLLVGVIVLSTLREFLLFTLMIRALKILVWC